MKRKPFIKAEHAAVATRLKRVRDELLAVSDDLLGRYGKGSAAGRRAVEALGLIDELRSSLDGQAARDLGKEFDPNIYYPGAAQ